VTKVNDIDEGCCHCCYCWYSWEYKEENKVERGDAQIFLDVFLSLPRQSRSRLRLHLEKKVASKRGKEDDEHWTFSWAMSSQRRRRRRSW